MADDADDGALLRAHVAGDSSAFGVLVRRHQEWMWLTARAMLGGHDEAMDVVQQTFIRAYRSAYSWQGNGTVASWLHRIVARVVLDMHAARARRPTPIDPADHSHFDALITPDDAQHAVEERLALQEVAGLPRDQRECVVRRLLGFTFVEIAADLGVCEGTVKSRAARGKARLVSALAEAGLVGPARADGPRATYPGRDTDPGALLPGPPAPQDWTST